MPSPDNETFEPTLTTADYAQLARRQTARYVKLFPGLLVAGNLFVSALDGSVGIIADTSDHAGQLLAEIVALRFEAYAVLGADTLWLSASNAIVYRSQTLPSIRLKPTPNSADSELRITLEANPLSCLNMQATTTRPVETSQTVPAMPAMPPTVVGVPMMDNLSSLAQRAGIDINYAVKALRDLNQFVGWNPAGYYQTTFDSWGVFSDWYAQNLKSLLGTPSHQPFTPTMPPLTEGVNGSQTTPPELAPESRTPEPRTRKTTARSQAKAEEVTTKVPQRFKSFEPSNGNASTIGKFLDAQKSFDATMRSQLVEAIAALPEIADPGQAETLAERSIEKILDVCKKANKRASRTGLIAGAKQMLGQASV